MAEAADEEEELAQWMPDCDDCDDNPAEHICKTCGDKLCGGCKDQHLRRKKTRQHEIVPYSSGIRIPQQSASMCSKHPGERYQVYCRPCKSPACSLCITQSHADFTHAFISITDAFSDAKDKATSNLEKMTKNIRPALSDYSEKNKEAVSNVQAKRDEAEQEMRRSAQLLHKEVDSILEDNLEQLQNIMEEQVSPVFRIDEEDGNNMHRKLEEAIKQYEGNLRSDDPLDLVLFMKKRDSEDPEVLFPIPTIKGMPLLKFNRGTIDRQSLLKQFGSLAISLKNEKEGMPEKDLGARKATNEEVPYSRDDKQESDEQRSSKCHDKSLERREQYIMKEPQLQSKFSLDKSHIKVFGLPRLFKSDRMFINGSGMKILLVDTKGYVLRSISTECRMYTDSGLCVSKDDELYFVDMSGKAVRKISRELSVSTLVTFTNVYHEPKGICLLQNGDLLVSFAAENVLRLCDPSGNVTKKIEDKSLFRPKYMAVNKKNGDICVTNYEKNVVVFTSSLKKRFEYTGDKSFDPHDLCCDQLGNILITDYINHRVHIIDRDGHFLQYLVCGKQNIARPIGIDIDNRGYAWIVENHSGEVKAFKYLQ